MISPQDYRLFVGVDSAAVSMTTAWMEPSKRPTRAITMPQTAVGHSDLQQRLLATEHLASTILVVMEATGSYWITLATTLAEAGFAVTVINPTQANNFAKALLKRAKTGMPPMPRLWLSSVQGFNLSRGRLHRLSILNFNSVWCKGSSWYRCAHNFPANSMLYVTIRM